MSTWTRFHTPEIVRPYDFGRFRELVDLGGNRGVLLTALLNEHPKLKRIVLDRAEVGEKAESCNPCGRRSRERRPSRRSRSSNRARDNFQFA